MMYFLKHETDTEHNKTKKEKKILSTRKSDKGVEQTKSTPCGAQ